MRPRLLTYVGLGVLIIAVGIGLIRARSSHASATVHPSGHVTKSAAAMNGPHAQAPSTKAAAIHSTAVAAEPSFQAMTKDFADLHRAMMDRMHALWKEQDALFKDFGMDTEDWTVPRSQEEFHKMVQDRLNRIQKMASTAAGDADKSSRPVKDVGLQGSFPTWNAWIDTGSLATPQIKNEKDRLLFTMDLPGTTKDQIKTKVEPRELKIDAQMHHSAKRSTSENDLQAFAESSSDVAVHRTLNLPVEVDPARTTTTYTNGKLQVIMPKVELRASTLGSHH